MQEDGADLNLPARLENDAWQGLYESAGVISSETDLARPIRMVTDELKRPVRVACPGTRQGAPQLRKTANRVRQIRNPIPSGSLLPLKLLLAHLRQ